MSDAKYKFLAYLSLHSSENHDLDLYSYVFEGAESIFDTEHVPNEV